MIVEQDSPVCDCPVGSSNIRCRNEIVTVTKEETKAFNKSPAKVILNFLCKHFFMVFLSKKERNKKLCLSPPTESTRVKKQTLEEN